MPVQAARPLDPILRRAIEQKVRDRYKRVRQAVVSKPERQLGAVWTSDLVARGNAIMMCESCWRRYSGWWRRPGYRPDWGWRVRSACDGCSIPYMDCTLFLPEARFHQVLSANHGRNPKP